MNPLKLVICSTLVTAFCLVAQGSTTLGVQQLATLRLVIEPAKERISGPPVSPAPKVVGKSPGDSAVPSAAPAAPAAPVAAAPKAAAGKRDDKCFDDLLSVSLGENDPAAKERLKRTKCQ